LNSLFNKWCSDKGTYWLSKHNYGSAYDVAFGPLRGARHVLELGVGDETAGSLNAWLEYFPSATLHIADIDVDRFRDEKKYAWASKQKRRHGCFDQGSAHATWASPRVHTLFGTDSSNQSMLRALALPAQLDIIIDDAAHVLAHQIAALEALWPRLRAGGVYVIEDVTIGALPWLQGAAAADQRKRAPSNNTMCGHECFYIQRPAEHPFIKRLVPELAEAEQRQAREALRLPGSNPLLPPPVESILDNNPWYWATTGAHQGGGLDSTIIIRKVDSLEAEEARRGHEGALSATADGARAPLSPKQSLVPVEEVPVWAVSLSVGSEGSNLTLVRLLPMLGLVALAVSVAAVRARGSRLHHEYTSLLHGDKEAATR
jgi:hypothetical protein